MSRRNLPDVEDLVIGTIVEIHDHGVYVRLDEYEDLYAYCHVSEVSSTWVRNIRNVVREGKKVVGRVLRIRENQIDISLKRVSEGLQRDKIEEWKHFKAALTLLEMAAKNLKATIEQARSEVEDLCAKYYGSLYSALEEALFKGEEAFLEAGVDKKWAEELTVIAEKNLTRPKVEIKKDLEIICWESNGVEVIRNALVAGLEARKQIEAEEKELKVEIYSRGAPNYRLVITARDYEIAHDLLSVITKAIEVEISKYNAAIKTIDAGKK